MILEWVKPNMEVSKNLCIIGSSDNVIDKGFGKEIDAFDEVVRFNRAPVVGWEEHVGSKTTIRGSNGHVFGNKKPDLTRFTKAGQDQHFIAKQKNQSHLLISPNPEREFRNGERQMHKTCKAFHIFPKFYWKTKKDLDFGNNPTVGFQFIYLCLCNGIIPHLYGFGMNEGGNSSHYWEKRDLKASHNMKFERNILKKWNEEGKIVIHL